MTFRRGPNGGFFRGANGGILRSSAAQASQSLHSFTLTDTSGAGSTGLFRLGLAFEKGDVATGQILEASIASVPIRSSMLRTNTYTDGSLRSCVLCIDAGTFTASETKTIDVKNVSGSQAASSINPVTYLNSIDDFTVEVRSHTGSENNTNVGNLDFSIQTAIATSTRRETTDDTDLCVRLWTWERVSPDEHLICINYVDIWLDTDGSTVLAVEWTPVMSQHWWVDDPFGTAMTKQERTYDATVKDGTTTLESYTSVDHGYQCRWAALRTANDDQHARRLWIDKGTAMPTLNLQYSDSSKARMAESGMIPPLYQGVTYQDPLNPTTYTPMGTNGHRAVINGTGAYEGRGVLTNQDAIAIANQTANLWRQARVAAQAGLSVFWHIRDHRNASGGAFNGDASMGLFPQPLLKNPSQTYTGLAGEQAIVGAGLAKDTGFTYLNEDNPSGTIGPFSFWDDAHHVPYSYGMAFVEGEAYLEDACLSAFQYPTIGNPHDDFGMNARPLWYTTSARRTAFSIADSRYGVNSLGWIQERSLAWTVNTAFKALALLKDGDRHVSYIKNHLENGSDWLDESLSYFPAAELARGGMFARLGQVGSTWMNNFNSLCLWDAVPIADDEGWTGYKDAAEQCTKLNVDGWSNFPYTAFVNRNVRWDDLTRTAVTAAGGLWVLETDTSVTGDTFDANAGFSGLEYADDDEAVFSVSDSQGNTSTLPTGVVAGQIYFLVNTTAGASQSFQFSETKGGSAISLDQTKVNVGIRPQSFNPATVTPSHINDDDFGQISYGALEQAYGRGSANVSQSLINDARTFYAPRVATWSSDDFAGWNMDGDLIR